MKKVSEITSKSSLAMVLSRLKVFENAQVRLEQYPTDSEIAADIVWNAYFLKDIDDKTVADLGCGTGILGISALIMGAKKVIFVDIDDKVFEKVKENISIVEDMLDINIKDKAEFACSDVDCLDIEADTILENPPFGTKKKHADKGFIEKSMGISGTIYSLHKAESINFIDAVAKDHNFNVTHSWDYDLPLKNAMKFHKKKIERIKTTCFRLKKA